MGFPVIVCLCGSTRFRDEFARVNRRETLAGRIVLAPGVFGQAGDLPAEERDGSTVKADLDDLHKRKIDLADEVIVINPGGYIGNSTRSEIAYAIEHGKPVRYLVEREALAAAAESARAAALDAEARYWSAVENPESTTAEMVEARAAFEEAMYADDSAQAALAFG